jgi:monoamine oxidase
MTAKPFDVVVVGAGLAGAAAAAELRARGLNVLLTEARERAGGRGYSRKFLSTGAAAGLASGEEALDFGGAWITPWQSAIRTLCQRHGIALRPRHPVTERRWFRGGALHRDGATAAGDRYHHERALIRIAVDSMLLKKGHGEDDKGRPLLGVSCADYLKRIGAPAATLELIGAWWAVSGNGDKAVVPASEFLSSCARGDGTPDGIMEPWTESLVGGVGALVRKMVSASGARLLLSAPIAAIEQDENGVRLTAADGRKFEARAAVIATGLNPLVGFRFAPDLPAEKANAVKRGHAGRAVKVWAKVRGVAPGVLATGGGGIEWMFAERRSADGATMLVGFGVEGPAPSWVRRAADATADATPAVTDAAAQAVARFFPEARLEAIDWHDWNADPYSRGAWVAARAGAEQDVDAKTWKRHGRVAFASSDFSPEGAGWFDAAAISGAAAAREIIELLQPK